MDLSFFKMALSFGSQNPKCGSRELEAQSSLSSFGERGEVILPLVLTLLIASFLFSEQIWLNKFFERRTKEHLSEFQHRWNILEKRYQD